MTKQKIIVNDVEFPSKESLKRHIRAIVDRYADGVPLGDDDKAFVLSLCTRHPDWKQKQGVGIDSVVIRYNSTAYGSCRGFWLIRTDKSEVDISWIACITPPSPMKCLAQAARYEIVDQRNEFSKRYFKSTSERFCAVSGVRISRRTSQVDHAYPNTFQSLLECWLEWHNLKPEDIEIEDANNGLDSRFVDRLLASDWQDFHRTNSDLQMVHKSVNAAMGNRPYKATSQTA